MSEASEDFVTVFNAISTKGTPVKFPGGKSYELGDVSTVEGHGIQTIWTPEGSVTKTDGPTSGFLRYTDGLDSNILKKLAQKLGPA